MSSPRSAKRNIIGFGGMVNRLVCVIHEMREIWWM